MGKWVRNINQTLGTFVNPCLLGGRETLYYRHGNLGGPRGCIQTEEHWGTQIRHYSPYYILYESGSGEVQRRERI